MEIIDDEEVGVEPVSPSGQYMNSSVLSLTILAVLEFPIPIDHSQTIPLLEDLFLPINSRFSSLMVEGKNGVKKWKKVEVNVKEHVYVPQFPEKLSLEKYDQYFNDYLTKLGMDRLPQNRPLWEIHIFNYPTTNSAGGNLIFKLHHSLGDGYSLIGALLSCLQRVDNPCIPLTFPSHKSKKLKSENNVKNMLKLVPQVSSWIWTTLTDFGWSILRSSFLVDDESPIRSAHEGVEFLPFAMTTMEFSLDQIKQIKTKLNVTVNDVTTGVILLGTRMYMGGEKKISSEANSNVLVLFNTRSMSGYKSVKEMVEPKAKTPWGNHFAFVHVNIPKISSSHYLSLDPLHFVLQVHNDIDRKKNNASSFLSGLLLDKLRIFKGPEATSKYIHNSIKNTSMVVSSLIGPEEQMALSNHPISGLYFAVAGAPHSLAVTSLSYVGKVRLTLQTEKGFIDQQKLKSCIQKAFDMIFEAAVDR